MIYNKIKSDQISFVLQGKNIKGQTAKCCKSIRKYFPESEIIFSTYENEDCGDLDCDLVEKIVDPGATLLSGRMYNNINRILATTKAGISKASKEYCCKIRSDMCFDSDKLLFIYNNFHKRNDMISIFKQRLVFYQLWSRKYELLNNKFKIDCPWYLSDWLCFGYTVDVARYFNSINFTKEPEFSLFFDNPENRLCGFFDANVKWRFPPEQYFCTQFFSKYFPEANMKSLQDFDDEKVQKSREVLVNNVIVAGYQELGAYVQKAEYYYVSKHFDRSIDEKWLGGVFSYEDFLIDYKQFCDHKFVIPFKYTSDLKSIEKVKYKLSKHFRRVSSPIKGFGKWVENVFSVLYYFVYYCVIVLYYFLKYIYLKLKKTNVN